MEGLVHIDRFLTNHKSLFEVILHNSNWDDRMTSRRTASFGRPYNYSQIAYPFQEFTPEIKDISNSIEALLGFKPNNCLINYYENGHSSMGFHSDQTEILEENTGVVIVSLGETRTLRFRNIENRSTIVDFNLMSGSLIYMTNQVQNIWQHAITKSDTNKGRMSLTFRKLK